MERLEKLERDNRRFKTFALAALVLPIALVSIYATRPVPQKITAHEFDLVDSSGTLRGKMFLHSGAARIVLTDARGIARAELGTTGIGEAHLELSDTTRGGLAMSLWAGEPLIELHDGQGKGHILMSFLGGEPSVTLYGTQLKPVISMSLSHGELNLDLYDTQGFDMALGNARTMTARTGQTQETSAASIIMFGNDKKQHVIWKAP